MMRFLLVATFLFAASASLTADTNDNQLAESDRPPQLRNGAFGPFVESLQRTLNKRLTPSPGLAVDGDFGPATEAAVRRFQRSRELPADGVVSAATWKALGTLIEHDDPVPPPEVINAQQLETQPETSYEQPPIVTAAAWMVADGQGTPLASSHADVRRAPASTTKLMTALLVVTAAEQQPALLEEMVAIDEVVDQTRGSSAKLRTGERYAVRDLLYGLMLPSGNDAAVALGQHLGQRLRTVEHDDSHEDLDSAAALDAFVAAMNRTATELGMADTHFMNPNGLPHDQHRTTAADLTKLAAHAMTFPLLKQIVSTRQYGCRARSEQGSTRNVVWKNTNRLLAIDGYHGVKTGTTEEAGACLIAMGQQQEEPRIVVILGSSSSDARYADARNLFRWSWSSHAPRAAAETQ